MYICCIFFFFVGYYETCAEAKNSMESKTEQTKINIQIYICRYILLSRDVGCWNCIYTVNRIILFWINYQKFPKNIQKILIYINFRIFPKISEYSRAIPSNLEYTREHSKAPEPIKYPQIPSKNPINSVSFTAKYTRISNFFITQLKRKVCVHNLKV